MTSGPQRPRRAAGESSEALEKIELERHAVDDRILSMYFFMGRIGAVDASDAEDAAQVDRQERLVAVTSWPNMSSMTWYGWRAICPHS